MKTLKTFFFFLLLISLYPLHAQYQLGQDAEKDELAKYYVDILDVFLTPIDNEEITKAVLRYATDDFVRHSRVYYNGNKVSDEVVDKQSFLSKLSLSKELIRPTAKDNYTIGDILFLEITGNAAVISSGNDISFSKDGELNSIAREIRSDRLIKVDGEWKFSSSTIDIIVTNVIKSSCNYRFYDDGSEIILAKINYPNGKYFKTDILELQFKETAKAEVYEVISRKIDAFDWRYGELVSKTNSQLKFKATSKEQVTEKLLMHYWGSYCTEIKKVKL